MKHNNSGALTRASVLACASLCAVSSVHAASGIWTGVVSSGLWSDPLNWSASIVADGAGETADFSTLDLPEGVFVAALDTPRTIGSLTFGDTDITAGSAGSWLIDNNLDPLNILTLSGTPVITVNALGDILGTPATAEISAELAGTEGLTKAGVGPLTLSGVNTFTGAVAVNAGTLSLNGTNVYAGDTTVNTGTLLNINAATAIGTGALTIAGGSLGTTFGTTLTTNNVQNWNSDISYVGPLNLNLGTGAVAVPASRIVTVTAGELAVGGDLNLLDPLTFTKDGPGDLRLNSQSATNLTAFTAPITLKAGILRIGPGVADGNQNGIGSATKVITFEGGALAANGSTGSNAGNGYLALANPFVVPSGQTGTYYHSQRGLVTSTLTGDATTTFNFVCNFVRGEVNMNNAGFAGTLNISSAAAGPDYRMTGATNFHAAMKVNVSNATLYRLAPAASETYQIGSLNGTSAANLRGSTTAGRTITWQVGALGLADTFAGIITNDTSLALLTKVGASSLTLTGENTYTGATTVTTGTLQIGDGGATGSLGATPATVAAGALLVFNRDNTVDSAYPGILAGAGTVRKLGNGKVTFSGVNTYTVATELQGGTIGITNASSLGAAANPVNITVANGGISAQASGLVSTRAFNVDNGLTATFSSLASTDSHSITGAIGGLGAVAIAGDGLTSLGGTNTYGGGTTVTSGTLVVASAGATSSGAVTVNGGTVGGTGTMAGTVSFASGSQLKPGALTTTTSSVGTLTTGGALSVAGGATLFTEFASVSSSDKVAAPSLTTDATPGNRILVDLRYENSPAKWTALGTYTLFQLSAPFAGNPDDVFAVTSSSQRSDRTYDFNVSGNDITLTIGGTPGPIWNVNASGNWTDSGNWLNGVPNAPDVAAEFSSAISGPQTVTLDADQTAGLLEFNNVNSYTIDGPSILTLQTSTGDAGINLLQGNHAITTDLVLADNLDIASFNAADSLTLTGDISGPGGITKFLVGDLTLGGNNSFAGDLGFSNGKLTFVSGGLGAGANLTLSGATLAWDGSNNDDITSARTVNFGSGPVTFLMPNDVTLANEFGFVGSANLTKQGAGLLTLEGDNNFPGSLTVTDGNLQLGAGGTTGSLAGAIALTGATSRLIIDRSDAPVFNNTISGTGGLDHIGAGTTTLGGTNSFSGTTTIAAGGTLVLGSSLALQGSTLVHDSLGGTLDISTQGAITLGGLSNGVNGGKDIVLTNAGLAGIALTVGGNNSTSIYGGALSGLGTLTKTGTGALTLTGVHTYTGLTAVSAGTLELATGSVITTTSATNGTAGLMVVNGGSLTASALTDFLGGAANGLRVQLGSATYNAGLRSANADASLCLVSGGTLTATTLELRRTQSYGTGANPAPAAAGNNGFVITGGIANFSGNFTVGTSNSGASALINGGATTVGGVVTVGNTTNTRWSILEVRSGSFTSTETVTGVVLSPRTSNANRSVLLVTGGTATVEKVTFGATTSAGTGRVAVSGGTLYVGSGGLLKTPTATTATEVQLFGGVIGAKAPWSSSLPIATANTFGVKAADVADVAQDITLSGAVTGTGSLAKSGDGILTLSGTYAYTGNTTVADGTLVLNTATLSDTSTVDITTGAVLNLPHGIVDTVRDFKIDGVSQGAGTFTSVTHPGLITGSGSLLVQAYGLWIDSFGALTLAADKLKTADPDKDGLTNFQEFGLDGDPTSGATSGKVRTRIEPVGADDALVITLPVRIGNSSVFGGAPSKTATRDTVIYTIEASNDLALFDQGVTEIAVSASGMPALSDVTKWAYKTFRLDGAVPVRGTKGFLRADLEDAAP